MPRESLDAKRQRAKEIVARLKKLYPDAKCSLDYASVHQLMVATILSAQCTDDRVNMVTPPLFKKYRTIQAFAEAEPNELGKDIFSTGFHNNKAKSIIASAKALLSKHNGEVPKTLAELVALPGVGRKTGSVVLGAGYGIAEGIVVDTHVGRISKLLGLTSHTDPVKIEQDLMKLIDYDNWILLAHLMIRHGRAICIARRPKCTECRLKSLCPSAGKKLDKAR
ncbi:MAG: endonuclease III [Candidatus Zixiibacteriota bacterium]